MKKYTKNWKEKAVRKENLITQVIFDMGFERGNSQAENRGQIKEEHFGKDGQYEQRQRGGKFIMALWDKR